MHNPEEICFLHFSSHIHFSMPQLIPPPYKDTLLPHGDIFPKHCLGNNYKNIDLVHLICSYLVAFYSSNDPERQENLLCSPFSRWNKMFNILLLVLK